MYSKLVNGKILYFNDKNEKLLSFSTTTKIFNRKYLFVNNEILSKSAEFGKDIMLYLSGIFGKETMDLSKCTADEKEALKVIIEKLDKDNKRVVGIESHTWNDTWHGYIDIECENCFIELKTRSNATLEFPTIIQCEIYKKCCGKDYEIWYYNKKTKKLKTLKPTPYQSQTANKVIKALELVNKFMNINITTLKKLEKENEKICKK